MSPPGRSRPSTDSGGSRYDGMSRMDGMSHGGTTSRHSAISGMSSRSGGYGGHHDFSQEEVDDGCDYRILYSEGRLYLDIASL